MNPPSTIDILAKPALAWAIINRLVVRFPNSRGESFNLCSLDDVSDAIATLCTDLRVEAVQSVRLLTVEILSHECEEENMWSKFYHDLHLDLDLDLDCVRLTISSLSRMYLRSDIPISLEDIWQITSLILTGRVPPNLLAIAGMECEVAFRHFGHYAAARVRESRLRQILWHSRL